MLGRALLRFPAHPRLHCPRSWLAPQPEVATRPAVLALRSYATPGRPKSVVGEPSKPVKRSVKQAARKPADGSSAAERTITANKRKTGSTKRLTPEEQAKRAESQNLAKERLAKRKASQKARETKLRASEKTKDLKKIALDPPKVSKQSAYTVFFGEKTKSHQFDKSEGARPMKEQLGDVARNVGAEWKNASPADIEHYNHLARTKKEEQEAALKRYIESHSADEIRAANNARAQLRRQYPKQKSKWAKIEDGRAPKQPSSSYLLFSTNRRASGDFKNIKLPEAAKLIGQEWKALNGDEKKKYENLAKQETDRYAMEYQNIFGHQPASAKQSPAP